MTTSLSQHRLHDFLNEQAGEIIARVILLAEENAEAEEVRALTRSADYPTLLGETLRLLASYIIDPSDERCIGLARHRAQLRFQQNVSASQMVRLSALVRQAVHQLLQEKDALDEAQDMLDVFDIGISDVEVGFASAYQEAHDEQWQASQTKYYWLFENASEAILSFEPHEGRILEANAQAERLLGRPRAELLQIPFVVLFAEEHRAQAQWLVSQSVGDSSFRLDDIAVLRSGGQNGGTNGTMSGASPDATNGTAATWDGAPGNSQAGTASHETSVVPVSLSCNWIETEGQVVAQVILRDMTQLRQMQRELQSYTEQLEGRVANRTQELQQSEDRYRALFLQEQRRAQHLSLINEVQKCALGTRDVETFVHQVTRAIQSHFRDCDITFLLCSSERDQLFQGYNRGADLLTPVDPDNVSNERCINDDLVVMAQAGGYGLSPSVATTIPSGSGLAGETMRGGAAPRINHYDASAGSVAYTVRTEAAVPLLTEGRSIGVILAQSVQTDGLEARDVVALQTACAIIASHLDWNRLYQHMRDLNSFNYTLVTTMLHSLMVVNAGGTIRMVNERACKTLRRARHDMLNRQLAEVLGGDAMKQHDLEEVLRDVTENGTPREVPEVQIRSPEGLLVFDLRAFRLYFQGEAQAVILLINITQRWRQTQQLLIMNQIGHLFQTSLDIDTVLRTVLICITAGSALGFNRAFLFLRDQKHDRLIGTQAIGPGSAEEAGRIWYEMSRAEPTLEELLAKAETNTHSSLQQRVHDLSISLDNPCFASLAQVVREQRAARLTHEELIARGDESSEAEYRGECPAAAALFSARHIAVAPLLAKDRVVGVVLADNIFSGAAIEDEDVQLLETLAQQAGMAIDNALTYQALQKAQQELVNADRLAVVGEMSARVSHEIRNPLATIGGFARSILKRPDETENVERKAQIVVDEVERLEELLSDLLEMANPRPLDRQLHSLNDVARHALLLADADIKAAGVTVEDALGEIPLIEIDRRRLLQALLNILRNGAQAMGQGGVLHVATRIAPSGAEDGEPGSKGSTQDERRMVEIEVRDTGVGMSERAVRQIFDPFFSTKVSGSGLGLAVTRRIIEDHDGHIDVASREGEGTTFILRLPVHAAHEATNDGDAESGVNTAMNLRQVTE